MTFKTGNPIGSTDARDLSDNAENMDYLENSTTKLTHADRLGAVRKTRHGMEVEHNNQIAAHESEHDAQIAAHESEHDAQISAHESEHDAQIAAHESEHDAQIAAHESEHDAQMQAFENDFDGRLAGMAFTRVGSFASGATLTDMRQVLVWEISQGGDGHEYGWAGTFLPSGKVVAAGSTPATSGGIGAGAWVDRTDIILRERLAATTGAGLVGTTGGYTVQAKLDAIDAVSSILSFTNDIGIANAYVCNFTPAITTRSEGQVLRFKVANTNTDASTLNDGVGVVPLVGLTLSALQGGEMVAGGDAWIQWHPYVGTGSYVLLFCSGAPLQVPNGSKSQHAVTLAQLNAAKGNKSGYVIFNSNQTLNTSAFGAVYESSGSASLTCQLPSATALSGGAITLYNGQSSGTLTASSASGVFYGPDNQTASSTVVLNCGEQVEFISDGTNWKAMNGAGAASLNSSGYQKLPSGLIIQWGSVVGASGSSNVPVDITFPIAFPNQLLQIASGVSIYNAELVPAYRADQTTVIFGGLGGTSYKAGITASLQYINNIADSRILHWIAIGN